SDGILVLPASTGIGLPLADVLGLDDTILEISLTPNRGDCLSHWGIARELAAALGLKARKPEAPKLDLKGAAIETRLDAGEEGPQFWGISIEGVKIGPSPDWMIRRLEAVGARSINNIVDATNLVMY